MDLEWVGKELEKYSFPSDTDDADIVEMLGLEQPLQSITLKAPQLIAHYFGLTHPRFIMSYDKGMGKTIAYLSVMYAAQEEKGKVIILCSENAKLAQVREIKRHLQRWEMSYVFVEGTRDKRKKAWESDNQVYITTYASLLADMGLRAKSSTQRIAPSWVDAESTLMALDEWHKVLRKKSSGTFKMLKAFKNKYMVFSSGSASGKGVHSQWAVLHLCNRVKFSAYWPYVQRHCIVTDTYFGKKIEGVRDRVAWRKLVAPHILHRRKDAKDYPIKTRQALDVRMEPWQKKAHDDLLHKMLLELPDGSYLAQASKIGALQKLRQFMVCPKSLSPEYGYGAGLENIYADAMDSELTHFVISTPFKAPIPFIEEFFRSKNLHTERLTGGDGVDHTEMEKRIARWTQKGGVIIQTIQFAESYELPAARIMYMLGYLHNHEQNLQAEDRIHRDIRVTPDPVDIYYVRHKFSYDEDIVLALAEEADLIHALMHEPIKEHFK